MRRGKVSARVRGALLRAASVLPASWEARLLAAFVGPVPEPVDVPATPVRLYIAPANYAGQAYAWARAAERYLDGVGARNTATSNKFEFPADRSLPGIVHARSRYWQEGELAAVLQFTHVVVEAERALFPRIGGGTLAEVSQLQDAGLHVAMLSHGSDVRSPRRHAESHEWSPFTDPSWEVVPTLEANAERNRAVLETLHAQGVPVFVSTPGLLVDVPYATWCPVTIDPEPWRSDAPLLQRSVPVVVHAPSNPTIKGTSHVEESLGDLAERGVIEYRRVEGVPHHAMADFYRGADIVVDQLLIGNYGTVVCEAMAAGRVVVSHIDDQVRAHVRSATGRELPVVGANPQTLRDVILDLVGDREFAMTVAARGPEFVAGLHDGRGAALALAPFLGASLRESEPT